MDEPLALLDKAIEECLATPLWARSAEEVVGYLERVHAVEQRIAALRLGLVREVDAREVAQKHGATSTTSLLRELLRTSGGAAARAVKLARALDQTLPTVSRALAAGEVNVEQAQVIADVVGRVPPAVRAAAEQTLVDDAAIFGLKELGRLGERILENVAPDLAEQREEAELVAAERTAHQCRSLHVVDVPGTSRVRVSGWLDREGAAHLRAALDPLSAPHSTPEEPDRRTPEQRRADGLVEICRRVLAFGRLPDSGGERPHLVVTVDYDKLRGRLAAATLDDGGELSPATVRRLACDAGVIPVVLKGAGQVLDIGRDRRLFSGHLRRALVARDRGCAFPGCDRPPRLCEGHHVKHWADGGLTRLSNAVLLCGFHHRLVHRGEWQVRIKGGVPEFVPPAYVDRERKPLRNRYHRRR